MKIITLSKRNFKELIRDPLTIIFAIILPIFLLFIFQQFDIPSEIYNIESFAPSIIIFGYAFISLFTATLISKDRSTSLLSRLYCSPLKSIDYIIGYTLSLLPIALIQSILFLITAILLGLPCTTNIIVTIITMLPVSLLFIFLGILIGSLVNDKASAGVGSIIVQLVSFTSGMYFSVDQMGGTIKFISRILPFSYAVDLAKMSLDGHLLEEPVKNIIIIGYTFITLLLSTLVFKKNMIKNK